MDSNLAQKAGLSLESCSERGVKQTTWRVHLSSTKIRQLTGVRTKTYIVVLKCGNKDANCYSPGQWLKSTRKSNVNVYYTGPEGRVSNCLTAGICLQTSKKRWATTGKDLLGMNSDRLWKDCFKVGNVLAFNAAREMAKSEE